jgi:hypothetical protein
MAAFYPASHRPALFADRLRVRRFVDMPREAYPADIRKVIYTTNAVESLNMSRAALALPESRPLSRRSGCVSADSHLNRGYQTI